MKVGILGLIGSGKDTFAELLQQELNPEGNFSITRYARPLKDLTSRVFSIPVTELENREVKETPMQVSRDKMIQEVCDTLYAVLRFDDEQMNRASELYFEHFMSNRMITPREFMQVFGTEVVRATKQNAWAEYLQRQPRNLIVPDTRFDNELLDVNILVKRYADCPRPKHSSEQLAWDLQFRDDMPHYNVHEVENYRTNSLQQLQEQAKKIALLIKESI